MNLSIEQELRMRFPEIYPFSLLIKYPGELAEYRLLNYFGNYCAENFGTTKSEEILSAINNLYESKDLFVKNAIENEFFSAMAEVLGAKELMTDLQKIPSKLQLVYIKVLLETLKIQKDQNPIHQKLKNINP